MPPTLLLLGLAAAVTGSSPQTESRGSVECEVVLESTRGGTLDVETTWLPAASFGPEHITKLMWEPRSSTAGIKADLFYRPTSSFGLSEIKGATLGYVANPRALDAPYSFQVGVGRVPIAQISASRLPYGWNPREELGRLDEADFGRFSRSMRQTPLSIVVTKDSIKIASATINSNELAARNGMMRRAVKYIEERDTRYCKGHGPPPIIYVPRGADGPA